MGLVFWAVHGTGRSVDGTQTASETLFTSPTSTNSCIDFIYLLTLYFFVVWGKFAEYKYGAKVVITSEAAFEATTALQSTVVI